jgi:hypothetical protein
MVNKSRTFLIIVAISFAFMISIYHLGSVYAQMNSTKNATQSSQQTGLTNSTKNATQSSQEIAPGLTTAQKYNNGYKDGLKNSQQDFKTQNCDPTVPTDVVHSPQYKEGYPVGYSKGPCGGQGNSSSSSKSNSVVPGLLR